MNRTMSFALVLFVLAISAGCSSRPEALEMQYTTTFDGSAGGRLVRANAVGTSWGFYLFGFIPIGTPTQSGAITDLYANAGMIRGRPVALVNVTGDRTSSFFLLFTLERIKIRADLVELGRTSTAGRSPFEE